jgi:hypothetical protein
MATTETTPKSSPAVATEILNQLGGRRFVAMTGSKNFVYDNSSLSMRLARNKAGAQYLNIKLNGLDLYNLRFSKVNRSFDLVIVAEYENIYAEDLQSLFTEVTGLYTSL